MLTTCMFHCSIVNIQAGEVAETIHVQSSAPELSSKRVRRTACCLFCHAPGQTKKTCTCARAQLWRSRIAGVVSPGKGKRRKQTVCFLALKTRSNFELLAITLLLVLISNVFCRRIGCWMNWITSWTIMKTIEDSHMLLKHVDGS